MKKRRKRPLKPVTPISKIKNPLRLLWLYSRERREALKMQNNTCQKCGAKASVAKGKEQKVEVHHIEGIDVWKQIVLLIRDKLLCSPEKLMVVCKECHAKIHEDEKIATADYSETASGVDPGT